MAKTLQFRRGTTAELSSQAGAVGELFVDTDKDTVVVMDGSTSGGFALSKETQTITAGSYANSAFSTANTAQIHAQAAFNAANTGGGGGASTGDFTFSANTITLPEFTDGTLNVTGNVGGVTLVTLDRLEITVDYGSGTQYSILATMFNGPPRFILQNLVGSITENDAFALDLASKITTDSLISLGDGTFGTAGQELIPVSTNLVYSAMGNFNGDGPAWTALMPTLARTNGSPRFVVIQEYQDTRVETDFAYTFSQTGEFISDSAVIGDVLISNDIITPIAFDSYGVSETGTLSINGDLDVLNDLSVRGDTFPKIRSVNIPSLQPAAYGPRSSILIGNGITSNSVISSVIIGEGSLPKGSRFTSVESGDTGYNTVVGFNAAMEVTTGFNNSIVGSYAGNNLTTGGWNTFIGSNAGNNLTTGINVSCIGYAAQASAPNADNEFTLGQNIQTLRCYTNTITAASDARDKKDITTLNAGLDFISKLKPVNFTWNSRDGSRVDIPDMGFIAQELKQTQEETGITVPGLVYESNPDKLEASYGKLIPILVKAIQDLQAEVENLKSK